MRRLPPALLLVALACRESPQGARDVVAGGDAERGRALVAAWGCGGCHTVPGVERADGLVGPSLAGLAGRAYLGGAVENTPERLVAWIRNPRALSPRTAMPALGVPEDEARHIAAYLLSAPR